MSNIVPFAQGAKLPAYLQNRAALAVINGDVVTGVSYPILSIKGKVFTLVKGSEKKVITRQGDDGDQEAVSYLNLTAVRANTKNRVFYAKAYVEGSEGEAARPDCYSSDGIAPAADARTPQATKCQICKHAVWGSKIAQGNTPGQEAKGTACTVNTRLAVVDPDQVLSGEKVEPYLLRVPAGSRSNFADVVKTAESRGIPYNALVLKVAFDMAAPSPKLTFKLIGLVDDDAYAKVSEAYHDETVLEMIGLGPVRPAQAELPPPAQTATEDDLDAALAARAARTAAPAAKPAAKQVAPTPDVTGDDLDALMGSAPAAQETPAEEAKPAKPAAKAKPAPAPAPKPAAQAAAQQPAAADEGFGNLLGDLDALLGSTDD